MIMGQPVTPARVKQLNRGQRVRLTYESLVGDHEPTITATITNVRVQPGYQEVTVETDRHRETSSPDEPERLHLTFRRNNVRRVDGTFSLLIGKHPTIDAIENEQENAPEQDPERADGRSAHPDPAPTPP